MLVLIVLKLTLFYQKMNTIKKMKHKSPCRGFKPKGLFGLFGGSFLLTTSRFFISRTF
jgi:hypothetical protein